MGVRTRCADRGGRRLKKHLARCLLASLSIAWILAIFSVAVPASQASVADYFVFEDTYAPQNQHPAIVQPWTVAMRQALEPVLTEAVRRAPGLVDRARAYGPIALYWVKEGRGATAGIATVYKPLNSIFFAASFDEAISEREWDEILQTFIHEITHLADSGMMYTNHPDWVAAAQPVIDRVRREMKLDLSKGAPGADDLPKKRIARQFGLASAYAAINLEEALAEVTADIVTDDTYRPLPELKGFIDRHLLSREFTADPAALKFASGLRHWHFGDMARAKAAFDEALTLNPNFGEAYLYRGLVEERQPGRSAAAMTDFTKAIELSHGANAAEAYLRRGRIYTNLGEFESAEKDLKTHFELRPWRWESSLFLGVPRLYLGKLDLALANFNHAAAFRIDYPWIFYFRGETYRQMRRCPEAIKDYGMAIELAIDPTDARPYLGRADCNATLKNLDAAIADYSALIEISPKSAGYHLLRAKIWQGKQDTTRALADLDKTVALNPNSIEAFEVRAEILQGLGRLEDAKRDLDRLVALEPKQPRRYGMRGELLEKMGDCGAAAADYTRVIALAPNIPRAFVLRAACRVKLKDTDGAISDLSAAIGLKPTAEAYLWRGQLYDETGRYTEAIADLEAVKRLDPSRADAIDKVVAAIKSKM